MASILSGYDAPAVRVQIGSFAAIASVRVDEFLPVVPSGSLRIGGDSPNGLVLVGAAPAARVVDLFDRETRAFVATTISASDGTYAFPGLSARPEGYDYIIRGNIDAGEKDYIGCGVHPG